MSKCKTCGAPVNLAPDGDPRYEAPRPDARFKRGIGSIERIYYMEGRSDTWRAAKMNAVARDLMIGNSTGWAERLFPRAPSIQPRDGVD